MTITLADIASCFEGVIPTLIATSAPDGMPNISYLSHVVVVDADHVALSNQFFFKTSANLERNPHATLLVVDGDFAEQYVLDVDYRETVVDGPLFQRMAAQLAVSSSVAGMDAVMRLRAVDVFRVLRVAQVAAEGTPPPARPMRHVSLGAVQRVVGSIAASADAEAVVDAVLAGLSAEFGFSHALFLEYDAAREQLATIGSLGYAVPGIGSEAVLGEGAIGIAAATRELVKISDLSRARRLGAAVACGQVDENRCRTIALPGLPDAMSQIAVPLLLHGRLLGVLYAESRERIGFSADDEAALCIVARQAAAALSLAEAIAPPADDEPLPVSAPLPGARIAVTHYPYDDSIFLDNSYVIKGVAGRLLLYLIENCLEEGRRDFSNRELRLALGQRLPELKDNLETRMLLLRRRLDEKQFPLRLVRVGRGLVGLRFDGCLVLNKVTAG